LALAVEQDRARTGGALVEGQDVLLHRRRPSTRYFSLIKAWLACDYDYRPR
jgi:hypothetical protein